MDSELIFWIVATVVGCFAFGVLWHFAKKDSANYIEWIADKK